MKQNSLKIRISFAITRKSILYNRQWGKNRIVYLQRWHETQRNEKECIKKEQASKE